MITEITYSVNVTADGPIGAREIEAVRIPVSRGMCRKSIDIQTTAGELRLAVLVTDQAIQ